MQKEKIKKPKIENVIHIPFIAVEKYLNEKYGLPKRAYYDTVTLEHHMFRGNDSSMNFFNQFLEEVIDEELRTVFDYLPEEISKFIFEENQDWKQRPEAIFKISAKTWAEAFVSTMENKSTLLEKLGEKNKYYFGYMVSGIYESLVMREFDIKKYDTVTFKCDPVFWYFTW